MMPRRPGPEPKPPEKLEKLPHLAAFELNEKTPKNQMYTIEMWNRMRERLLLLKEMEEK